MAVVDLVLKESIERPRTNWDYHGIVRPCVAAAAGAVADADAQDAAV